MWKAKSRICRNCHFIVKESEGSFKKLGMYQISYFYCKVCLPLKKSQEVEKIIEQPKQLKLF